MCVVDYQMGGIKPACSAGDGGKHQQERRCRRDSEESEKNLGSGSEPGLCQNSSESELSGSEQT